MVMVDLMVNEQQSEVAKKGVPVDWHLRTIGDVVSFSGGSQPPRNTFVFSPKEGYIRLIQIRDYKTNEFETYIPEHLTSKRCNATDIMIGRYGPPIFQILRGIEGAYNVALIKASPSPAICNEYLYHFLKTKELFELIELLSQRSSGQTGIDLPALKAYPIPLPSKEEQLIISGALSDTDGLISKLEKLITKKQAIKTATMQQLLTGKTRLSQFALREDGVAKGYKKSELGEIPEDWTVTLLNDVIDSCSSGATPYRGVTEYYKGNNRWITSGELNYCVINDTIEKISDSAIKDTNLKIHPAGTFLMAITGLEAAGTRGACGIVGKPSATNQSCMAIYPNNKLDSNFLYHWYVYNGDTLAFKYCQGTKQLSYTAGLIKKIPLFLPTDKKEQTAITAILSDMDKDIQTLQQRLDKTRQLKQGMMQELLTGKTRLI
ncbi:restriction endonuclease subunit S [uncultured Pantoea sp.]|uniref:restriction endonuclease subunit S n=1 Tax=uncultured Pantoea sp. TaxID=218084 RepID=UPI002588AD72|nr:restriction endonuclease subunit S [uncultured Pantoea sp.]